MSLATWKKKYYPVTADKVSEVDAAKHSLKKWKGLRPAVLRKHGLKKDFWDLTDKKFNKIAITSTTCALCCHHVHKANCLGCPLNEHLTKCLKCNEPFQDWACKDNPKPMIAALEAVVKKQKEGKPKPVAL